MPVGKRKVDKIQGKKGVKIYPNGENQWEIIPVTVNEKKIRTDWKTESIGIA